jgi:hypothetical protein
MVVIREVGESEVIAEYLKAEFYNSEYHRDRHRYEPVVFQPNLQDASENETRRALLFRRRNFIWQELPKDTRWWDAQFSPEEIANLRVFPRGKLKRTAGAELTVREYCEALRSCRFQRESREATQVFALSYAYREHIPGTTVLLIGLDQFKPVSILDGNHRLIAALFASSEGFAQPFRFVVGFSDHMADCVWYNNTPSNNIRYWRRRLVNSFFRFGRVQRFPAPAEPNNIAA